MLESNVEHIKAIIHAGCATILSDKQALDHIQDAFEKSIGAKPGYNYVLNLGSNKNDLQPEEAYPSIAMALADALRLIHDDYNLIEILYAPEDDMDINIVVYRNFEN